MSMKRDAERDQQTPMGDHAQKPVVRERKRRWGAVDTLIVLALVLAVAGVIVRGFMEQRETPDVTQNGPFDVYFTVAEIHSSVLSEISGFDMLYDYETGNLMGYIGVYADGSAAINSTGVLAIAGGDWVSAQGCMVCLEGSMTDGSLLPYDADKYISPGSVLTLRTERAVLTVTVTDIVARN